MILNIATEQHNEARELRGLFEKQLKELYWAENTMAEMLPHIAEKATSADLVVAIEQHIKHTFRQAERLREIFTAIGIKQEEMKYEALHCLMQEADSFTSFTKKGVVRDAGIISVLQKIKHYEIACYGTMRAYSIALREDNIGDLLEDTLNEEKDADQMLTKIAESHINIEAADKEI